MQQAADQRVDGPGGGSWAPCRSHQHGLEPESYTEQRLRHASGHHLHMTSRRFFIGPIPKGWLQNHRKSWFKTRLRFKNYSSKTVSFSLDPVVVPPDSDQPPSPIPEQDESGDTTGENEIETEDANESSGQETGSRPLRTISHTLDESSQIMATPASNTDAASYFTAREQSSSAPDAGQSSLGLNIEGLDPGQVSGEASRQTLSIPTQNDPSQLSPAASASELDSTTELLRPQSRFKGKGKHPGPSSTNLERQEPLSEEGDGEESPSNGGQSEQNNMLPFSGKIAKYNLDDNLMDKKRRLRARVSMTYGTFSGKIPRRNKMQEGEILKAENMLIRVEETMQKELPEDYTENDSQRMETRVVDKWREFLVVCRKTSDEDAPFSLEMYRTRVIPELQKSGSRIAPYYKTTLGRKHSRVNLYSSLDKTIVIWGPSKLGTKIYILRPRSTAHAVEWYTFICQVLGWRRPSSLPINIPDLGVSLIFNNPFVQPETNADPRNNSTSDSDSPNQPMVEEQYAAAAIIRGCIEMLESRPEWTEVLKEWSKTEKMGLAWKRYDRLEWVFGVNEEKMYGTMAMQTSHELELRPRQHYSTSIKNDDGKEEEPEPVEGFLVRLTSQRGAHQRMNKMFFKRLYFFTQDHHLLFCKPSKSFPPAPPKLSLSDDTAVPSSQQILDAMPLSYGIDPYPLKNGEIKWLSKGNKEYTKRNDEYAYAQLQRNLHNLKETDGYVDLCRVQEVRRVQRGSSPADPNIDGGPDVGFHPEPRDTNRDDGATDQFDDERTFEMAMDNGLVMRLQAYDTTTRDEWMKRLDALVKYWKARCGVDAAELKNVRRRNMDILDVDEETESLIGQFARKWEVKKTEASPHLHNMCALSGCRPIRMSGHLYRKPRRHTTFKRCSVILTAGQMLIFRSSLRKRNGVEIPHIHQELESSLDLQDCYIYSGLLTENDLLYANQTFDSNRPGRHALPRVYLSTDVYTSSDEDSAVTFVVWQPLRKNYFRAREAGDKGKVKNTLKQVSTLGVHGRTVVFKARSRVEKDIWVSSIASEIDRLQEERQDDIRIVSG
ncbi:hypothetical protein AWENTII_008749 [Aspergillus wentii]